MIYIEKGTHKIIQSPKYPKKYLPNLNCSWTISTVRDDERVRLQFTSLNIGDNAGDQLILYDGKGIGKKNNEINFTEKSPNKFALKTGIE